MSAFEEFLARVPERRVERVQGGKHQMAGFRGEEPGLDRLEVAHFADQDDVRVLSQRAAQGVGE